MNVAERQAELRERCRLLSGSRGRNLSRNLRRVTKGHPGRSGRKGDRMPWPEDQSWRFPVRMPTMFDVLANWGHFPGRARRILPAPTT